MSSQLHSSNPRHNVCEHHPGDVGLLTIITLVVWIGCLFVGLMEYISDRPGVAPTTNPTVMNAQPIEIELTSIPPVHEEPALTQLADAALTDVPNDHQQIADPTDALPTLEEPAAAIAFAVAADGPVRVALPAAGPTRHVTGLTLGKGLAANQPKPEYPREAQLAAQEGEVIIEFTVDTDGNIAQARVAKPCRWPLLNHAALQTVRDQWHLPPGRGGLYTVPLIFQMRDGTGEIP